MNFVYKHKEEEKLIKSLSGSKLISKGQLLEVKELYHEYVPYHNFVHALKVAEWVLRLPKEKYNIIEIQSLFIAALFHDAWHTWTAEDLDEFRSLDLAFQWIIDFEKKHNYTWIDYSIVRKAIIGTVFKNRGKNKNDYAILLADIDVSSVWMEFSEFLYYADFPFSIECWVEIHTWLKDVNFFKFLTGVEKNIFRTQTARHIYPHALSNIKQYLTLKEENISKLYNYWKENDISYEEFEKVYRENN